MEGGSNYPPPFLTKTYEMVDDSTTDSIVSWSSSGDSFLVLNTTVFSRDLLPKYFKHSNFSSFVRQLNTYGFRKIDPEQWEFANEEFARGQRHLLNNIHRRKPVHSHSLQAQSSKAPLSDVERDELEGKIEGLRRDKNSLMVELNRHIEQQNGGERQMLHLEEKMKVLLNHQKYIVEYLSNIVQIPGFLSNLVQQPALHCKKRRLVLNECIQEDADYDQMHDIQTTSMQKSETEFIQPFDLVPFEKMESTLNTLENFFRGASLASGVEMYYDLSTKSTPCVVFSQILTRENIVNSPSSSPKLRPSSPCVGDIRSSPDLADSGSYVQNSGVSSVEVSRTLMVNISDIDITSEPVAPEAQFSRDTTNGTGTSVPAGGNDVFWQQFFTENPGSDTQEVQSGRKEAGEREGLVNKVEWGNFWWNRNSVGHLTERIDV